MFGVQCTWCDRFWMHTTCLLITVQHQKDYYLLRFGREFFEKHLHIWLLSPWSSSTEHLFSVDCVGISAYKAQWCVMAMIWPTITLIDTIIPRENTTAANKLKITSFVSRNMVFESGMQSACLLHLMHWKNDENNNARKLYKLRFLITLQCIWRRRKRNPRLETGKKHQFVIQQHYHSRCELRLSDNSNS